MKNLRNRFERFCYQNRNIGIPNLMLYVTLGSAVVYILSMFDRSFTLYYALCFDRTKILQGQIWRLFTYALTFDAGNVLMTAIGLICYYSLGKAMENTWGTLRFNLFYLSGIVLMDIFCLIFGGQATIGSLNLSLFLGYATLYPNSQFLFLFIIPIKAWIFAVFYLVLTLWNFIMLTSAGLIPYNLYPFISIGNYFLFFGKDVVNVFPVSWRVNFSRLFRKRPKSTGHQKPIDFYSAGSYQASTAKPRQPYQHRCVICGRTDVSDPNLEFRYCSRCNGYYCYCEDHISNHTHVE